MRRLLTIGHSYVVGENRRLAHEMAIAGQGEWEVTAVAPEWLPGDLGPIRFEGLAGERCRVVPVRMWAPRSPHLRHYRSLAPVMAAQWDVVHCWEEPYVAAGWQVARQAPPGARLVVATFQNLSKRYPPPFAWMERAVLRRAAGWIAFGRTAQETLAGRDAYATRPSKVIGPGVDAERFAPDEGARAHVRAALGWDDSVPVIGFLGRFVPAKGIDVLLATLPRLVHPWRALFVGGGPLIGTIRSFAATHGQRVMIVEGVAHDEVARYLNAMDVLCAPSRTTTGWREQFGRMLIEAMACGVPVAGSNSGEIPHVIGDAGIVLPEGDVDTWVAALDALLGDEARRRHLAVVGRTRVLKEFTWTVVARRHLDFFDSLLAP